MLRKIYQIQLESSSLQKKIKLEKFIMHHQVQFMVIKEFIQQVKKFKQISQFLFMV